MTVQPPIPTLLSKKYRQDSGQNGFVMMTVLLFMVLLMIVALAAMRSTKDEVSIAGSRYFRNQTMHNSQSTLSLVERCVSVPTDCGLSAPATFSGSEPGWLNSTTAQIISRNGSNSWIGLNAWASNYSGTSDVASDNLTGLDTTRAPQYAVERLDKQCFFPCEENSAIGYTRPYRITVRGQSPNDGSTVLLQRHIWTLAD